MCRLHAYRLLFLLVLFPMAGSDGIAQGTSNEEVRRSQRAIFIYNFTRHIEWENFESMTEFKIGVLGNDPVEEDLRTMAKTRTVKGKPIKVLHFKTLGEVSKTQLLYVNKLYNFDIAEVLEKVTGSNTLVVSENYGFNESMINMVDIEGKFEFELDETRIKQERLRVSPTLKQSAITSASHWQELYLDAEKSLESERKKVEAQQAQLKQQATKLKKQKNLLANQQKQIKEQRDDIVKQTAELDKKKAEIIAKQARIDVHNEELNVLLQQNTVQQKKLDDKIAVLDVQEKQIAKQEKSIRQQQRDVNGQNKVLKEQRAEIMLQEGRIEEQKTVLGAQSSELESQRKFMYLLIAMFILGTVAGIFIYRGYKIKKKANMLLEAKNIAIQQKTDELEKSHSNVTVLREIGQKITATLDLDTILDTVHESVGKLMDATVFAIAVYNWEKEMIEYKLFSEKGEKLEAPSIPMSNKNSLAVACVEKEQEILISEGQEFLNYVKEIFLPEGEMPESVIYLPMYHEEHVIGCITAQSFEKNAYTNYHVEMLRALASYTTIAMYNASTFKILEQKNKELENLSIVASETDNAVYIMDGEGNLEWANEGFTKLTGYTLEEYKKEKGSNLLKLSDNPVIESVLEEIVKTKQSIIYEAKSTTKDNNEIWLQTTLTPIFGDGNKLKSLVAIDSDITEMKLAEVEIKKQKELVEMKSKELQQALKDVVDSIEYARRIQEAILTSDEYLKHILPEHFIFYKPRDIVSGDFYWGVEMENNKTVIVAADCTGHGVPGALMSMVGNSLLNETILEHRVEDADEILNRLRDGVIKALKQKGEDQEARDGMDMALCIIDRKKNTIEFAGANNPLYHVTNGELITTKGDKQPLGYQRSKVTPFTKHKMQMKAGDAIYLFSDGFADQFGGPSAKKFKYRQFRELLLSIQDQPMKKQGETLQNTFETWRGDLEQIDDVCVIGIKF